MDAVNAAAALFAKLQAESFGGPKGADEDGRNATITATIGTTNHWLTVATNGRATASSTELAFQVPAPAVTTLLKPWLTAAKPER